MAQEKLAKSYHLTSSFSKALIKDGVKFLAMRTRVQEELSVLTVMLLFLAFFVGGLLSIWIGDKRWELRPEAEALLWATFAIGTIEIALKAGFWTGAMKVSSCSTLFKLSIYLSLVFTYIVYPSMVTAVGRLLQPIQNLGNSQPSAYTVNLPWVSLLVCFGFGIITYYCELRFGSTFPNRSKMSFVLDHKFFAGFYVTILFSNLQSQLVFNSSSKNLGLAVSTIALTALVFPLGLILRQGSPCLFWSVETSVLVQALTVATIAFKTMIEIGPALLTPTRVSGRIYSSMTGAGQLPTAQTIIGTLLMMPLLWKIIASSTLCKIKIDPLKKELNHKTRLIGIYYLISCVIPEEGHEDRFLTRNKELEIYYDGMLHHYHEIALIRRMLYQARRIRQDSHSGRKVESGHTISSSHQYLLSEILPDLRVLCCKSWLLLASRGLPSLVEVYKCLQELKEDTGMSEISAQLEYYNFRKLYEHKLDLLYKPTLPQGEISIEDSIEQSTEDPTSELNWYFKEHQAHCTLRYHILNQIQERVDLYRYISTHPITKSSRIHKANKSCLDSQKQIQVFKQKFLQNPESHISKPFTDLIYYFGVVRSSKKTADDLVKVYKKKLGSILSSKLKLESLYKIKDVRSPPSRSDLAQLMEQTTVSLQVSLETQEAYEITQLSENHHMLLGHHPMRSTRLGDLSSLLPGTFVNSHRRLMESLVMSANELDYLGKPDILRDNIVLLDQLHQSHAAIRGATLVRTFDQRTVVAQVAAKILPCLHRGVTSICRIAFGRNGKDFLLLLDTDLNYLEAEPLVKELIEFLTGSHATSELNLNSLTPELAIAAKMFQLLYNQNMRNLIADEHCSASSLDSPHISPKKIRKVKQSLHRMGGQVSQPGSEDLSPIELLKEILQNFWHRNNEQTLTYSFKGRADLRTRVAAQIDSGLILGVPVFKIYLNLMTAAKDSKHQTVASDDENIEPSAPPLHFPTMEAREGSSLKASESHTNTGQAEVVSLKNEEKSDHSFYDMKEPLNKDFQALSPSLQEALEKKRKNSNEQNMIAYSSGNDQEFSFLTTDQERCKNDIDEIFKPLFALLEGFENFSDKQSQDFFTNELASFTSKENNMKFRILISELQQLKKQYYMLTRIHVQNIGQSTQLKEISNHKAENNTNHMRSNSMHAKLQMRISKLPSQRKHYGLIHEPCNKFSDKFVSHPEERIGLSPKVDAIKMKLFLIKTRLGRKPKALNKRKLLNPQKDILRGLLNQKKPRPSLRYILEAPAEENKLGHISTIDSNLANMKQPLVSLSHLMELANKSVPWSNVDLKLQPATNQTLCKLLRKFQSLHSSPVLLKLESVKYLLDLLQRRNSNELNSFAGSKRLSFGQQRDQATDSLVGSARSSVSTPIYLFFAALDQQIQVLLQLKQHAIVGLTNFCAIIVCFGLVSLLGAFTRDYILVNFSHFETLMSLITLNSAYRQLLWSSITNNSLVFYWSYLSYLLSTSLLTDKGMIAWITDLVQTQYRIAQTALGIDNLRPFINQRLKLSIDKMISSLKNYELNQQQIYINDPEPELRNLSDTAPADFYLNRDPAYVYRPVSIQTFIRATLVQATHQYLNTEEMAEYFDDVSLPFVVPRNYINERFMPALASQISMIQNSFRGALTNMEKEIIFIGNQILGDLPEAYKYKYMTGAILLAISLFIILASIRLTVKTTQNKLFRGISIFSLLKFEDAQISMKIFEANLDEFRRYADDEYNQVLKFILSTSRSRIQISQQTVESKSEHVNSEKSKLSKGKPTSVMQNKIALRRSIRIKQDFTFASVKSFLYSSLTILALITGVFWASISLNNYLLSALKVQRGYLDNYLKVMEVSKTYLAFNLYSTYGYFIKIDGKDADCFISGQPVKEFQSYWISKRADFEGNVLSEGSNPGSLQDLEEIIFGNICNQLAKHQFATHSNETWEIIGPILKICHEYLPTKGGLLAIWDQLPPFMDSSVAKLKVQAAPFLNTTNESIMINLLQDNLITAEGTQLSYLHDFAVELILDKYSQIITESVNKSSDYVTRVGRLIKWATLGILLGLYILSLLRFYIILKRDSDISMEGYSNVLPEIIFNNPYLYQVYREQFMQVL